MPAQGNCDGTQYQVIGFSSYPRPYLESGDVNEKLDEMIESALAMFHLPVQVVWEKIYNGIVVK